MLDARLFALHLITIAGLAAATVGGVALSAPSAGADPAPPLVGSPITAAATIMELRVQPGGHEATVSVRGSEPIAISYSLTRVSATAAPRPAPRPLGALASPEGAASLQSEAQLYQAYQPAHQFKLTGLTSNSTFNLEVTATTAKGQSATARQSFTTLKQRARLTLDTITIGDDGDWIGDGEPTWYWKVTWAGGETGACFPFGGPLGEQSAGICEAGSYSEQTVYPDNGRGERLSLLFAEENFAVMPAEFTLTTTVEEADLLPLGTLGECLRHIGCLFIGDISGPTHLHVPQDKEFSSQSIVMKTGDSGGEIRTTMYFRFETFFDNRPYPPNHRRAQVHGTF